MNGDYTALFLEKGTYQAVTPGGRFSIMERDYFWYVAEGAVDIFLTADNDNEDSNTSLHHLIRINKGQILFGSETIFHHNWVLLARNCSDTQVIKVPKIESINFSEEIHKYLSDQIDDFIIRLTKSTVIETFPKSTLDIFSLEEISVEDNTNVSSGKGVKWLKVFSSNSFFLSDSGMSIPANENFFPVTPTSWFEIEKASSANIFYTSQLMPTMELWNALEKYFLFNVKLKLINIESAELYDNVILYEKVENNQLAIQDSLTYLNDSFQTTDFNIISYEKSNDPVYVACMQICTYMNISLKPISVQTRHFKPRDYFYNLMAYSKIFYRKVRLYNNWYHHNQGPLLGFEELTASPVAIIPKNRKEYQFYTVDGLKPQNLTPDYAKTLNIFAYILSPTYETRPLHLKDFVKTSVKRSHYDLVLLVLCYSITALLGLVTPFLTRYIFVDVIISNNRNILFHIFIILVAVLVATAIFGITKSYLALNLESKLDCTIQAGFWDRILKLPISFFRQFSAGELTSRIGNLVDVRNILSGTAINLTLNSIFSVTSFFVLFYYQPLLATIVSAFILLFIIIYYYLVKQRIVFENIIVLKSAKIFGVLSELFLGITKIRLSGAEYRAFLNWAVSFSHLQEVVKKSQKVTIWTDATITVMPLILLGIMYVSIGWLFQHQAGFTTGSFLAFNVALGQITAALYSIMSSFNHMLVVSPLYNKSKIFIESLPEVSDDTQDPGEIRGEIEISKISFKYKHAHAPILKDVNLNIAPGEYIAIVGKSGSGKSTLLRLLLGFETPTNGRIYFDSKDSATLDYNLVRRQFGVVLQHDDLNPGNIFSNISGISDLTIDEAWGIAEKAGIAQDILEMPMQMNTLINLEGSGLSGGQKQRLLIARAIARNPKILILDEATRSLDNVTQRMVIDSLSKMKMTRIVVAHRLSTLVQVDKIFVLNDGQIVESGSYNELLNKNGYFFHLVQKQLV